MITPRKDSPLNYLQARKLLDDFFKKQPPEVKGQETTVINELNQKLDMLEAFLTSEKDPLSDEHEKEVSHPSRNLIYKSSSFNSIRECFRIRLRKVNAAKAELEKIKAAKVELEKHNDQLQPINKVNVVRDSSINEIELDNKTTGVNNSSKKEKGSINKKNDPSWYNWSVGAAQHYISKAQTEGIVHAAVGAATDAVNAVSTVISDPRTAVLEAEIKDNELPEDVMKTYQELKQFDTRYTACVTQVNNALDEISSGITLSRIQDLEEQSYNAELSSVYIRSISKLKRFYNFLQALGLKSIELGDINNKIKRILIEFNDKEIKRLKMEIEKKIFLLRTPLTEKEAVQQDLIKSLEFLKKIEKPFSKNLNLAKQNIEERAEYEISLFKKSEFSAADISEVDDSTILLVKKELGIDEANVKTDTLKRLITTTEAQCRQIESIQQSLKAEEKAKIDITNLNDPKLNEVLKAIKIHLALLNELQDDIKIKQKIDIYNNNSIIKAELEKCLVDNRRQIATIKKNLTDINKISKLLKINAKKTILPLIAEHMSTLGNAINDPFIEQKGIMHSLKLLRNMIVWIGMNPQKIDTFIQQYPERDIYNEIIKLIQFKINNINQIRESMVLKSEQEIKNQYNLFISENTELIGKVEAFVERHNGLDQDNQKITTIKKLKEVLIELPTIEMKYALNEKKSAQEIALQAHEEELIQQTKTKQEKEKLALIEKKKELYDILHQKLVGDIDSWKGRQVQSSLSGGVAIDREKTHGGKIKVETIYTPTGVGKMIEILARWGAQKNVQATKNSYFSWYNKNVKVPIQNKYSDDIIDKLKEMKIIASTRLKARHARKEETRKFYQLLESIPDDKMDIKHIDFIIDCLKLKKPLNELRRPPHILDQK